MSTCPACSRHSEYTAYVRSVRRNSKTHHNKQAWIPVGFVCVYCEHFTFTMDPGEKINTLMRGAKASIRGSTPLETESGGII